MPRKRYKPSVGVICKIGTIAHNRPFTAKELREYSGSMGDTRMINWLRKHGHIMATGYQSGAGTGSRGSRSFYPTPKGWKMIEAACIKRRK